MYQRYGIRAWFRASARVYAAPRTILLPVATGSPGRLVTAYDRDATGRWDFKGGRT